MADVPAHEQDETFTEHDLIADHAERSESETFRHNKAFLRQQHPGCWMQTDLCDAAAPVEAHHIVEWCQWPNVDPDRLKLLLRTFDPYGYSAFYRDRPIASPDDIRNLILLCDRCHRERDLGAHDLTWPTLWARKARRVGVSVTVGEARLRGAQ